MSEVINEIEYNPEEVHVTEIFPAYVDYLQPCPYKFAYGGRGSAKTRTFVSILLNNVRFYGWRLACFREVMKSIDDSVFQEFIDEIERLGIDDEFRITRRPALIQHRLSKGKINFEGLLRNTQKLKGFAGYDAFWVEEAENVSKESWDFLIPTLRKGGSELWVSYNPLDPLSATHLMCVTEQHLRFPDFDANGKRYCISKLLNYTDNPRFPEKLRQDMELMKENDYELYLHVYEGQPVGNSELAIIKPMWIAACIDAHKKKIAGTEQLLKFPGGAWYGGFDVADEGKDKNAFVWRHSCIVYGAEEWKDDDPNTAARMVFNNAIAMGLDAVAYDNIGVGAGAKGAIREEERSVRAKSIKTRITKFRGFTANAEVVNPDSFYVPQKTNKDMFTNLKAQAWWLLRDRFKNTFDALQGKPYDPEKLISLSSEITSLTKLTAELSQPRREFLNGKFKVESKKDMAKRGVVSPNLADGLVMCFAPDDSFDIEALI